MKKSILALFMISCAVAPSVVAETCFVRVQEKQPMAWSEVGYRVGCGFAGVISAKASFGTAAASVYVGAVSLAVATQHPAGLVGLVPAGFLGASSVAFGCLGYYCFKAALEQNPEYVVQYETDDRF